MKYFIFGMVLSFHNIDFNPLSPYSVLMFVTMGFDVLSIFQ